MLERGEHGVEHGLSAVEINDHVVLVERTRRTKHADAPVVTVQGFDLPVRQSHLMRRTETRLDADGVAKRHGSILADHVTSPIPGGAASGPNRTLPYERETALLDRIRFKFDNTRPEIVRRIEPVLTAGNVEPNERVRRLCPF